MVLNTTFFKLYKAPLLLALVSLLFYTSFAYDLVRTDYTKLVLLYTALFFLFYKLVQLLKTNIKLLSWLAFGFRAVFILAAPNLSQDFYRFIWDGRMILEGFNPYLFTVESFIAKGEFPVAQAQELYNGMGQLNAGHFSNYPPINQLCFVVAGLFSGKSILGSVVVMRLLIITADFGTLFFGKKLLEKLNLPAYHVFWYILNPFTIIELTGNLHFEGVMVFFLIWSLYLLHIGKWLFAAIVLGLSVSVKLIPLIFLPLFWQWFTRRTVVTSETNESAKNKEIATLRLRSAQAKHSSHNDERNKKWISVFAGMAKLFSFYAIVCLTVIISFLPFYTSEFITNYTETVALWFNNFEFNASLYYIVRAVGYTFRGYNEIAFIGKTTPIIVILFVLMLAFFRRNRNTVQLITAMLLVLSFYYFTATTVHPWYIATLLMLSVFTKYRFPLVWSFVIVLSYLAYLNVGKADKSENLWIIALEYAIVYGVFIWEVFKKKEA